MFDTLFLSYLCVCPLKTCLQITNACITMMLYNTVSSQLCYQQSWLSQLINKWFLQYPLLVHLCTYIPTPSTPPRFSPHTHTSMSINKQKINNESQATIICWRHSAWRAIILKELHTFSFYQKIKSLTQADLYPAKVASSAKKMLEIKC